MLNCYFDKEFLPRFCHKTFSNEILLNSLNSCNRNSTKYSLLKCYRLVFNCCFMIDLYLQNLRNNSLSTALHF